MVKISRKRLGEILIEENLVTAEQLEEALNLQANSKDRKPIGELLIELGYLSEEGLCLSISKKLGIKYLSSTDGSLMISFDQNLDKLMNEKFTKDNLILPLSKTQRYLSVAMWDPLDFVVVDNLKKMAKTDLVINCATKRDIMGGIDRLYGHKDVFAVETRETTVGEAPQTPFATKQKTYEITIGDIDELKSKAAEAPVVKIVNNLIHQAVKEKASDIHIDPQEEQVSVRFRIDGILYEIEPPPKDMVVAIISRIKILSRLDIAEKRLPQDGGFAFCLLVAIG